MDTVESFVERFEGAEIPTYEKRDLSDGDEVDVSDGEPDPDDEVSIADIEGSEDEGEDDEGEDDEDEEEEF